MKRWTMTESQLERKSSNGRVIQVRDTTGKFTEPAALKMLLVDKFHKYSRFKREVRIASELNHVSIVKVIDQYLPESPSAVDPPFFVMPWLPGGSLYDRLRNGDYKNRLTDAVEVFLPILEAVKYLHSQGKYHREIKPQNILFDGSSRPVLTDFGLAFDLDTYGLHTEPPNNIWDTDGISEVIVFASNIDAPSLGSQLKNVFGKQVVLFLEIVQRCISQAQKKGVLET